jgi:hypothetical protein
MSAYEVEPFPIRHLSQVVPKAPENTWLVEGLWSHGAVGFIGGAPKSCKTWLACEIGLAVATGQPALGRYPVHHPGKVLFYGAEDDPASIRARFESIARARGLPLEGAPLFLLDVAELRLEHRGHIDRLKATVSGERPVLVVLDPFVRIARIDENSAAEVSAVLGDLRAIQRETGTAILVAHHMRKSQSGHRGYRLRGSGDFAAWHDSALYLGGSPESLVLHVEHRASCAPDPIRLRLMAGESPHLAIAGSSPQPEAAGEPLLDAILELLGAAGRPLTTLEVRNAIRARKQTVIAALDRLRESSRIARSDAGWLVVPSSCHVPAEPGTGTTRVS